MKVPAHLVIGSRIDRARSALGGKTVLCLQYRAVGRKRNLSRVWLTGMDIHVLREKLADLAAPVDVGAVESLVPHLDADAESILRLLWERRHASIRELSEHTRMPSHMDILLKIREVINPLAEEFLGFPLLAFAPVRRDTFTGEEALNSWWILGAGGSNCVPRPEIMVDTFDEANCFSVLACLPCGEAAEVNVSFSEGEAEISSGENLKPAAIPLPAGLEPKNCRQTFRNGILELRWERASRPAAAIKKGEE